MRRWQATAITVTTLGTLAAGVPFVGSAGAAGATSAKTIVSHSGVPAGFLAGSLGCSGNAGTSSVSHVTGPAAPPLGKGSLELSSTSSGTTVLDYGFATPPATDLTALSLGTFNPGGTGLMSVLLTFNYSNTGFDGAGLYVPGGETKWGATDLMTATLSTYHEDSGGADTDEVDQTLGQFLTAHPGAVLNALDVYVYGCAAGAHHGYVDDVTVGLNGAAPTTYDFEPLLPAPLVAKVSKARAVAGDAVTPSVSLVDHGTPVVTAPIQLQQRKAGAKAFTVVGTYRTNTKGVATAKVQHPTVTTSYRWHYAGEQEHGPATTAPKTVTVASGLSVKVSKARAANGELVATGKVTPKRAGLKVTLWRVKGKHRAKLGSAKTRRDGSYSISTSVKAGHYKIEATVVKDSTNAAGTSPAKKVTVH